MTVSVSPDRSCCGIWVKVYWAEVPGASVNVQMTSKRSSGHAEGMTVPATAGSDEASELVNWWLGSEPQEVFGYGRLGFYGADAGIRHGLRRDYQRAYNSPQARDDPFALDISAHQGLRELYLDAEADSGYIRDRNVFDGEISIEDDMAVLVRYVTGASMSYHLTAYSPWEGYRVMFNGSAGRLELEVVESHWQPRPDQTVPTTGAIHGEVAMANAGGATIRVRRLWEPPTDTFVAGGHGGHGGGDERMLTALYGPPDLGAEPVSADAARQSANQRDGALALAVGVAANECFVTGQPVRIADLVEFRRRRRDELCGYQGLLGAAGVIPELPCRRRRI
jgi:hypothetical protein